MPIEFASCVAVDNSPPKPAPSDVRSDKVVTNHFVNEPQLSDKPKVYSGYSVQSAKGRVPVCYVYIACALQICQFITCHHKAVPGAYTVDSR